MWQWMGVIAFDIANEKTREAQDAAERWLLLHANDELTVTERRQPLPRRVAAGMLRRVSGASISIGEAACDAAARLDHRTA
jgi:hypothetical protein